MSNQGTVTLAVEGKPTEVSIRRATLKDLAKWKGKLKPAVLNVGTKEVHLLGAMPDDVAVQMLGLATQPSRL